MRGTPRQPPSPTPRFNVVASSPKPNTDPSQREGVYHYTLARALGMPGPIYLGEFAHAKGFPETETEFATTVDNGKGGLQSAYSVKLDKLVLKLKELAAA